MFLQLVDGINKGNISVGNGCGVGIIVSLQYVIVEDNGVFFQCFVVNDGMQGMVYQVGDFMGVVFYFVFV